MSTPDSPPNLVYKVVVVFDICSSTTIIDDLLRNGKLRRWRNFLIRLKNYLLRNAATDSYEIYKFLGDGYILLFDPEQHAAQTLDSLYMLNLWFDQQFPGDVARYLDSPLKVKGMTFGMDEGELVQIVMQNQSEYVGRAINVAARLQGIAKECDSPSGKVLMSNNFYSEVSGKIENFSIEHFTQRLRNVNNGAIVTIHELDLHSRVDEHEEIPDA